MEYFSKLVEYFLELVTYFLKLVTYFLELMPFRKHNFLHFSSLYLLVSKIISIFARAIDR